MNIKNEFNKYATKHLGISSLKINDFDNIHNTFEPQCACLLLFTHF